MSVRTCFCLLFCCDLRCKEISVLARKDFRLDRRYLDILQSKEPKSRGVYISRELADYLTRYDNRIVGLLPDRKIFFPNKDDCPYSPVMLERSFLRFWYAAFPKKKDSGVSIRAYDFRYHFVYANMNRLLRERRMSIPCALT